MIERIGAHTHILGLGLNEFLEPMNHSDGMVGQLLARKAAGIILQIVAAGLIAGQAILLSGTPGSGKTAIVMGMAKTLGTSVPFTMMAASEIFSLEISKTESITQAVRKTIRVQIVEETEIIQGEVVDIVIKMSETQQNIQHGKLTIRTTDIDATYDIGPKMIESLMEKKISTGDVINIDKKTGKIILMGCSNKACCDHETVSSENFTQCPEGELQINKDITHEFTLHEIDSINSSSRGFISLFSGNYGEIRNEVRQKIDIKLKTLYNEGTTEFIPGILFIDEVHLLDIECFSYITRILESDLSPTIVFASNRGLTTIRGSDNISAHGIPVDLLDRMLIIHTLPFSEKDIKTILEIKIATETIKLSNHAKELLTIIGKSVSLRYAIQLLTLSNTIAHMRNSMKIYSSDISKAYGMFIDVKRSAQILIWNKDRL